MRRGVAPARRDGTKWLVVGTAAAIVAWLALVPLVFLLWQSFASPNTTAAAFTLASYRAAFSSEASPGVVVNSLVYAAGSAALALVVGTVLAWINERTNAPFKSLFFALAVLPLIIPSVLFVVAWTTLASPRIGAINVALRDWLGIDAAVVDIYSLGGMIWVDGLHDSPIAFLMMSAAFRAMGSSIEEAALVSGATVGRMLRRITLPLMAPTLLALFVVLFIRTLESFEAPALLGLPAGITVFTTAIYDAVHRYPSDIGMASAYATVLLLAAAAGMFLQSRLTREADRHATVTGQDGPPWLVDLGRWRHAAAALLAAYLLVLVVLPLAALVWTSLHRFHSPMSLAALDRVSLDAYRAVLDHPGVATAVVNSLLLALGSATAVMLLTAVVAWIVLKTRLPGRWLLDALATVPVAIPGIVLGLALLVSYLAMGGALYGTLWILLLAYVTRFLPYGMRYSATTLLQIGHELEEAAAVSGATWAATFRRVILPLMRPGLLAGWLYVGVVSIRELSSSVLLYSPGSEVVAVVIWEMWQNGQIAELSALGVLLMAALLVVVVGARLLDARVLAREV